MCFIRKRWILKSITEVRLQEKVTSLKLKEPKSLFLSCSRMTKAFVKVFLDNLVVKTTICLKVEREAWIVFLTKIEIT